jgi:cytochrome c556
MVKKLKWGTIAAFVAVAMMSGGAGVLAQSDKEGVIKQRREAMKGMGKAMGAVKGYMEGKTDLKQAEEGAGVIAATAPKIPQLFPPGTSLSEFPGKTTGAKPVIWTEHEKFIDAQKQLVSESEKLVDVVKTGDKAKIGAQFASDGKNGCGNCHNTFREKLE